MEQRRFHQAAVSAAFFRALHTITAVVVAFVATYALCVRAGTGPAPAILSAALCVGLMRRPDELTSRSVSKKIVTLPVVALAAGLIGLAFLRLPWMGALLFTAGVASSVALRGYGERGASIGRAIALPLLTMLVVPVAIDPRAGIAVTTLLVVAAALVAILSAATVAYLTRSASVPQKARPARKPADGAMSVPVKMAWQMLVALALAFSIGMTAFAAHWPWVVLSAFIVCSGAIGRGDALYKALLRLAGAVGGTFAAAVVAHASLPNPATNAALIFVVLFAGIWLRQMNYAYWAACATLIFALLQGSQAENETSLFGLRVLCILIGALCGVVAVWFVYPIRTEQVVRRRVADALGAMRDALGGSEFDPEYHAVELNVWRRRCVCTARCSGRRIPTNIRPVGSIARTHCSNA
ncbi:MAG TPA: FUSC family protein [Candidatus Baltobacteraceae bacterium]